MSGSSPYVAIDSRIDRHEFMEDPDAHPILKAMFSKAAIYPNQIESYLSIAYACGPYAIQSLFRVIANAMNIYLSLSYRRRNIQVEIVSEADDIIVKFTEKDIDITQDVLVRVIQKRDLH